MDFKWETFHTLVVAIAVIILAGVSLAVVFAMKNTSRTGQFPPIPAACPDKWTSDGIDSSGNPFCKISDPSSNLPLMIAIGTTNSAVSRTGSQWTTKPAQTLKGIVHRDGNTWLGVTSSNAIRTFTVDDVSGGFTVANSDITITTPLIPIINGIYRDSGTVFWIYGADLATNPTMGKIQKITYTAPSTYVTDTAIDVKKDSTVILTNIKGFTFGHDNSITVVGTGNDNHIANYIVSSSTWKAKGKISDVFTPTSIAFNHPVYVVVGTGTGSYANTTVYISSNNPTSNSTTMGWQRMSNTRDRLEIPQQVIYNADMKMFVAIGSGSNKQIATSLNGYSWQTVTTTALNGGVTIGYKTKDTEEILKVNNQGIGTLKTVGPLLWDDVYRVNLQTSTICDQRNWANINKLEWDGVSNYNSC